MKNKKIITLLLVAFVLLTYLPQTEAMKKQQVLQKRKREQTVNTYETEPPKKKLKIEHDTITRNRKREEIKNIKEPKKFLQNKRNISESLDITKNIIIKTKDDIAKLFPKSAEEIVNLTAQYIKEAQEEINKIIAIDSQRRTYKNTVLALDRASSFGNLMLLLNSLYILEMVSPEEEIRKVAKSKMEEIEKFKIDQISSNKKLYEALVSYEQNNKAKEFLSQEEAYYLEEKLKDYKRAGLGLPEKELTEVTKIKKELVELTQQFDTNISTDNKKIMCKKEELTGLEQDYINSLKKDEHNNYILDVNGPTYTNIMQNCQVETTRKNFYIAYNNKAYPKNKNLLQKIIEKRDMLAKKLGFETYAHYDLDSEMAKDPQIAKNFIESVFNKADQKAKQEFELFSQNLPEKITLTQNGRIKPWDSGYIKNYYKKKHFNLDQQEIKKYFPMEPTIKKIFAIYEKFFNITLTVSQPQDLWHKDVLRVEIYSQKDNTLLGYLLLDLYPRDNKYSHACSIELILPVTGHGPAMNVIITNFPKPTKNKPSLLTLGNVKTFCHELGHALHCILGMTTIASFSGFNTKIDFVEVPSQMLEEWLYEKEILQIISCHYETKRPLPSDIIEKIINLRNFNIGSYLQRQCTFGLLALQYFGIYENKDVKEIYKNIKSKTHKYTAHCEQDNMYASFGHLTNYGAKYYSYMWSKVFAVDIFYTIKENKFSPEIGQKYAEEILSKGGSIDPNVLLKNFLGREPNADNFFKNLGLW